MFLLFVHERTCMNGDVKKISIIKDYIEKGGGNFLNAKNCPPGSIMTIQSVSLDEETYDKPRIVATGIFDKTGEECNASLGIQNVKRIAEIFGDDETKWVGKKIQCLTHADYPGLGTTGLLWGGLGASAPSATSGPTMSDIIGKIMVANKELTAKAVKKLIDEEVKKAEGLLTEDAAAHIVASTLGVEV